MAKNNSTVASKHASFVSSLVNFGILSAAIPNSVANSLHLQTIGERSYNRLTTEVLALFRSVSVRSIVTLVVFF